MTFELIFNMTVNQHNFKLGSHNIKGLHNRNECKIQEITKELVCDIEILSEVWGCGCEKQFEGYEIIAHSVPVKHLGVRSGRKSGGIIVLCRNEIKNSIKVKKNSKNFVWTEIDKRLIKNLEKNLILVSAYIHDANSSYYDPSNFEDISHGITVFCDDNTPLIIMGDLNSRTGLSDERFSDPQCDVGHIDTISNSITLPMRRNCDTTINGHGEKLLNLCRTFDLTILNGRSDGDPHGCFTYCDPNLGSSTIDYGICNLSSYNFLKNFMVLPQNELSDHCKIITELALSNPVISDESDKYDWNTVKPHYIWDQRDGLKFKLFLENANNELEEIK